MTGEALSRPHLAGQVARSIANEAASHDSLSSRRMLVFSTLFPNQMQPNHGVFVENRLRHLATSPDAPCIHVIAPIPYVPGFLQNRRGDWNAMSRAPSFEIRSGLPIEHPRYAVIPRVGTSVGPALLYASALREVMRLRAQGIEFDLIDAHYMYPDGVAAVRLGRSLGIPVVVTVRGSDITLLTRYAVPRRRIVAALQAADAVIAVSSDLGRQVMELGAKPHNVHVLRNGVDADIFTPCNQKMARHRWQVEAGGPVLLSVGHLIERKGHDRVITALSMLPADAGLLIAGEGPERAALQSLAHRLGVGDRVRLLGAVPHGELAALYSAADALVLASSREGWPNVLLEAMACGTPVVTSPIAGNIEVMSAPACGVVANANTPADIAAAIGSLLHNPPSRADTRLHAEAFGWASTTEGQLRIFRQLSAGAGQARRSPARSPGR